MGLRAGSELGWRKQGGLLASLASLCNSAVMWGPTSSKKGRQGWPGSSQAMKWACRSAICRSDRPMEVQQSSKQRRQKLASILTGDEVGMQVGYLSI